MVTSAKRDSAGFSLVELMVGMTIGLITTLIVTQIIGAAEVKRRESTSGTDAVVNASLGLYTIERDGKNAGYGLTSLSSTVGCPIRGNGVANFNLTAASITNGQNGAPDRVRFLASTNNNVALPMRISQNHPINAANFFVDNTLGVEDQDLMLAVPAVVGPGSQCTIFQHSQGNNNQNGGGQGGQNNNGGGQGQNMILHPPGQSELNQNIPWPADGYTVGDAIINLGNLADRTYRINPGTNELELDIFLLRTGATNTLTLYPNIVQLQAVYGKAAGGVGAAINAWDAIDPMNPAEWQQIRAIRVALVARSQVREQDIVTLDGNQNNLCDRANPHPAAVCWKPDPNGNGVTIDVSAGNPDWQRFRYRVVETTIPLRNLIWRQ